MKRLAYLTYVVGFGMLLAILAVSIAARW